MEIMFLNVLSKESTFKSVLYVYLSAPFVSKFSVLCAKKLQTKTENFKNVKTKNKKFEMKLSPSWPVLKKDETS